MRHGRPLRFLALVLGGWTAARVAMLWPAADGLPVALAATEAERSDPGGGGARPRLALVPPTATAGVIRRKAYAEPAMAPDGGHVAGRSAPALPVAPDARSHPAQVAGRAPAPDGTEVAGVAQALPPSGSTPVPDNAAAPLIPTAARPDAIASRLHGDLWLVARSGGGDALAFGQLGASQAGARLTYALGRKRRVALSGRVSAPLRGRGAEAAAGLDWQPLPVPVHLLAEARVPLDGGAVVPAVQAIGGGAMRLPLGFVAEGYAQAGAVRHRGAFADGSARVIRRLAVAAGVRVEAGAGAWGAAQRGVARADVGPTVAVAVPVGGAAVRLGVDYRFRIAGRARPGSGPALTLGSSF